MGWTGANCIASGPSASTCFEGGEGGVELFVLDGEVICEGRCLPRHGWLRLPPGTAPKLGGKAGTLAWIKTGHLTP
jgi:hypothetical protein